MKRMMTLVAVAFAALLLPSMVRHSVARAAGAGGSASELSNAKWLAGLQLAGGGGGNGGSYGNEGGGNGNEGGGDDNGGGDDRCKDQDGWKWGNDDDRDCTERECEPDDVSVHKCKHDPDDECCEPGHHHHHHGDGHDWWT
jgi:hypothetical protein